ncbi:hypothetical protein MJL33_31840, partial [Salmonella enterica subsp. enterica serovar Kentucky]|nr:hypothetical protein [Salmonella enterica subsp. enterica serovar Kentucky]
MFTVNIVQQTGNSLRLAIALREQESHLDLRLFLMSDAVTAGLRGQKPAEGYNI